ncbi:hypothetical protein BGZ61DRAFT_347339 [Ilyonectria robusta]|uniref:uncharacterized protein n=1 Tax=Ilyonectria robusta TaxID=1079257 RepID=UPI001E8D28AB|nr:uncharacterized protein BGZ61DRAFT_347339 [Ilyonectria robusta]KAH8721867.1 hypothetical protein BGZ61DRAFT_347339 [Ilyonectria robusta]
MTMLAAQVAEWGASPKAVQVPLPATPTDDSMVQIRVRAAGLHQLVRTRAAGKHYTAVSLPHTPGVDGTGVDVSTGKQVYFNTLGAGTGTFAELVNVPRSSVAELPSGVDAVQAAGLMNPVMSSWMALRQRVDFIKSGQKKDWSCFILGATSMSGKLAIKVARMLGATRVIGAGRNEAALKTLGLDEIIVLKETPLDTDFGVAADVDVVLDYLYGPWIGAYLGSPTTRAGTTPLTWVCIGSMAGLDGAVPAAGLRQRDVSVRGSGPGAWSTETLDAEAAGMLGVLDGVREEGIREVRMEDVEAEWTSGGKGRVIFVLGDVKGEL